MLLLLSLVTCLGTDRDATFLQALIGAYRESFRPAAFLEMFGQEEDAHSLGSQ